MAVQDVPYFGPPKFNPDAGDDFRCFVFRVKEYCALYKLNIGMPRRHIIVQGLPDTALKVLFAKYGSTKSYDQDRLNWVPFDEIVKVLDDYYYPAETLPPPVVLDSDGPDEKGDTADESALDALASNVGNIKLQDGRLDVKLQEEDIESAIKEL